MSFMRFLFFMLTISKVIFNLLSLQSFSNLISLCAQDIFIRLMALKQILELVYCHRLAVWNAIISFGSVRYFFLFLLSSGHVLK